KQPVLPVVGAHEGQDLDPVAVLDIAAFQLVDMQGCAQIAQQQRADLGLDLAMTNDRDVVLRPGLAGGDGAASDDPHQWSQYQIDTDHETGGNGGVGIKTGAT